MLPDYLPEDTTNLREIIARDVTETIQYHNRRDGSVFPPEFIVAGVNWDARGLAIYGKTLDGLMKMPGSGELFVSLGYDRSDLLGAFDRLNATLAVVLDLRGHCKHIPLTSILDDYLRKRFFPSENEVAVFPTTGERKQEAHQLGKIIETGRYWRSIEYRGFLLYVVFELQRDDMPKFIIPIREPPPNLQ